MRLWQLVPTASIVDVNFDSKLSQFKVKLTQVIVLLTEFNIILLHIGLLLEKRFSLPYHTD